MSYAELAAFKTQTKIKRSQNDETKRLTFLTQLKTIKLYKKIYNGLNLFIEIIKEKFHAIEDLFSIFGQRPTNSLNDQENSFLSNPI